MGAVYRARQISRKRAAAVKILLPRLAANPTFLNRFQREARVLASLHHPNIVRCYGLGKQHGRYYLAMELVDGGNLRDWLDRLGKFSVPDAVHVVLACARALQHAHVTGLVHRDIKPDNLLLTRNGEIKVADLGLATDLAENLSVTQSDHGAGTPVYVAPEQARRARDADARSDLYALGCMFYQMVTGELPFRGDSSLDIVLSKLEGNHLPVRARAPEVPEAIEQIIDRLLAPHPDDRLATASELIDALEALQLASPCLSFLTPATTEQPGTNPDVHLDPCAATTTLAVETTRVDTWFVISHAGNGTWVTQQLTAEEIIDRMSDEDFVLTARVGKQEGDYQPLTRFPEFRAAQRARKAAREASRPSLPAITDEVVITPEDLRPRRGNTNWVWWLAGAALLLFLGAGLGAILLLG